MKICKPEYLAQAQKLSKQEQERLLSRMAGKLPKRMQKEKLSIHEAMAIQLEIEDEQLQEWRERMQQIKSDSNKKAGKTPVKADKKALPVDAIQPKAPTKSKAVTKAKPAKKTPAKSVVKPAVKASKKPVTKASAKSKTPAATPAVSASEPAASKK